MGVAIGMEQAIRMPLAVKRQSPRLRFMLAATIRGSGDARSVRLRDLSRHGALIDYAAPLHGTVGRPALRNAFTEIPAVGQEIVFSCGDIVTPARVTWVRGSKLGLKFRHAVEQSALIANIRGRCLT